MPGGFGTRALVKDEGFLKSLALASERSTITTTVCTGSALLARTGASTDAGDVQQNCVGLWSVEQGPRVQWQRRRALGSTTAMSSRRRACRRHRYDPRPYRDGSRP